MKVQTSAPTPLDLRHWPKSPQPLLDPLGWALAFLLAATILLLPSLLFHAPEKPATLEQALARTTCAPANAPLEIVFKHGSVADNGTPRVECVYVTAGNGAVPKQRREAAVVAGVGR